MKAVMTETETSTVKAKGGSNGFYVEYSKPEVPLSVKKALWDDFKKNRPEGIDLSDEEIQEMVNEVRYGNKHGKAYK
jgi:hypothetical protein